MRRRWRPPHKLTIWGWTFALDRNFEWPIELDTAWLDETTAYVALNVGKRGCDPWFSVNSPDLHPAPGGMLDRFVSWLDSRTYRDHHA